MPSFNPDQGAAGGGAKPADPGKPDAAQDAADTSFEAHDARLAAELRHYGRTHAGSRGFEYGHDESYSPGYHEGGVRFGFFNDRPARKTAAPASPDPGKNGDKADDQT
jgi:hypothetical protein